MFTVSRIKVIQEDPQSPSLKDGPHTNFSKNSLKANVSNSSNKQCRKSREQAAPNPPQPAKTSTTWSSYCVNVASNQLQNKQTKHASTIIFF